MTNHIERRVMSGRALTITRAKRRRSRRDDAAPATGGTDSRPAPILMKPKSGPMYCGNCHENQEAGTKAGDQCWMCKKPFSQIMEQYDDAPPPAPAAAGTEQNGRSKGRRGKRADDEKNERGDNKPSWCDECKKTTGGEGDSDKCTECGSVKGEERIGDIDVPVTDMDGGGYEGDSARGKRSDDASPGTVVGYAAVSYNEADPGTEYELWNDENGRAVERLAAGCFEGAMARQDDVAGLYNHEPDNLLGRSSSGTLSMSVDGQGLRYEIDLPDTQVGRDVAELVDRGDLNGSSFGFVAEDEEWQEEAKEDGTVTAVRTLRSVRLLDVGPVTYPAYSATSAAREGDATEGETVEESNQRRRKTKAGQEVRAVGSVAEARSSYLKWKAGGKQTRAKGGKEVGKTPGVEAAMAMARARAVAVAAGL